MTEIYETFILKFIKNFSVILLFVLAGVSFYMLFIEKVMLDIMSVNFLVPIFIAAIGCGILAIGETFFQHKSDIENGDDIK